MNRKDDKVLVSSRHDHVNIDYGTKVFSASIDVKVSVLLLVDIVSAVLLAVGLVVVLAMMLAMVLAMVLTMVLAMVLATTVMGCVRWPWAGTGRQGRFRSLRRWAG